MKVSAIIPVAGRGKRFGGKTPKQFLNIGDQSIIEITLKKFLSHDSINHGVVLVSDRELEFSRNVFLQIDGFEEKFKIVIGGKKRQDSVYNGLKNIPSDTDIVIIHDGVRPLVSSQLITQSIQTASATGACIAATPVKDTIKRVQNETIIETISRDHLWQAQTPQAFKYSVLKDAHNKAKKAGFYSTDDSSLVEWYGHPVNIILGEYSNIKITTTIDLNLSQLLYQKVPLKCE